MTPKHLKGIFSSSQQIPQRAVSQKKVSLFAHLDQYERDVSLTKGLTFASGGIHPAILRLGLQYARGIICGANARLVHGCYKEDIHSVYKKCLKILLTNFGPV